MGQCLADKKEEKKKRSSLGRSTQDVMCMASFRSYFDEK